MTFLQEMEAKMAAYVAAFEAQDAAGCAAIYAEDAAIYTSWGPPIHGRASAAMAHEDWFTLGEKNKRIDVLDCAASGNQAYCLIAYSSDVTGEDGTERAETGINLCVLARIADEWLIRHSSMTADVLD